MVTPGNITVTGSDLLKEASRIRGFSGRDDYDLSSFPREVDTVLELFRENANTRLFVIQRYVVTKIHGEALNVIRLLRGNSTWEEIKAELIRNFEVKESYHNLYHRAISIRNTNYLDSTPAECWAFTQNMFRCFLLQFTEPAGFSFREVQFHEVISQAAVSCKITCKYT
ncbi:hypothetical protein ACLKA6_002601 [Drosophila palustris]